MPKDPLPCRIASGRSPLHLAAQSVLSNVHSICFKEYLFQVLENVNQNTETSNKGKKQVNFKASKVLCDRDDFTEDKKEKDLQETHRELDDRIPPDLERYIRVSVRICYLVPL